MNVLLKMKGTKVLYNPRRRALAIRAHAIYVYAYRMRSTIIRIMRMCTPN